MIFTPIPSKFPLLFQQSAHKFVSLSATNANFVICRVVGLHGTTIEDENAYILGWMWTF